MKRRALTFLGGCIALFITGFAAFGQNYTAIRINELLADNEDISLLDNTTPDYVELYNTSSSSINIGGMSISDSPSAPTKYVIPANTTIGAQGFLLIYFDDNTNAPGLHTGFTLGGRGDTVRLFAPGQTVTPIDTLAYGIQVPDMSVGRVPDGTGAFVLNEATPLSANRAAILGSITNLHINEWMANSTTAGIVNPDWVEFYNSDVNPVQIGGLTFTDDNTLPSNDDPITPLSFVAGKGFALFTQATGNNPDPDEFDFGLSSTSGERITLHTPSGAGYMIIHQVIFPAQAENRSEGLIPDGNRSQVLRFDVGRDTPGASNVGTITNVVINEVLAHTDPPLEDAIELHNVTAQPVDISNWWLSDSENNPRKYRIPAGTIIPANGYVVFYEYQFGNTNSTNGFNLSSANGDDVVLNTGDASGNLTGFQRSVSFGPSLNGVSIGRVVVSTNQVDFVPLTSRTFGVDNPSTVVQFRTGTGTTNSGPLIGPVVINEIHYNPPGSVAGTENQLDEYIELHNISGVPVPLFHTVQTTNTWKLGGGVEFDFPTNVTMPAGGFLLIVNFDPATNATQLQSFRTRFNVPTGTPIFGPFYSGSRTNPEPASLSNGGEEIELKRPDFTQTTGNDIGLVPYINVDQVDYNDDPPWPLVENASGVGTGNSLQKLPANSYGNYWANWRSLQPTAGGPNIVDADGDGMTDFFENTYQFNPNDPADAALDADSDGSSNLHEFLAGTHPRNAQSVFRMTPGVRSGGSFTFSFQAVAGKSYQVQYRDSYNSQWVNSRQYLNVATTGAINVTDLNANNSATRFYRVVILSQ